MRTQYIHFRFPWTLLREPKHLKITGKGIPKCNHSDVCQSQAFSWNDSSSDVSRHLLQKTDHTLPRFQAPKYGRGVSGSWCEGNLVSATGHRLALMAASLHHRAPWHQNIQTAPASSLGFPTGLWWVALNRATEGPWLCWSKRKIKDSLNDKNDWNWGISCTRGPPVACIGPHPAKKKRGERVRLYGFTTDYAPTTWDPTASVVARRGGNQPATLVDLTNSDF